MNKSKLNLIKIIISLSFFLIFSCEKWEANEKPTIRFLSPGSNLIISNDTVITFIVEPFDKDGKIDRVEFTKNGTIVQAVSNSPFSFEWSIKTKNDFGTHSIKATAYDNKGAKGEAEIQIEIKYYLTEWLGVYEGTSHHWMTYPQSGQFVTNHSYENVVVSVNMSSQYSCLDFVITYNDSITDTKNGLMFSTSGAHFSQWGGGSGYGSLNISFEMNSLKYKYFQKCGIPCGSGIDFNLNKK